MSNMSNFQPSNSVLILSSELQRNSAVLNQESMGMPDLTFSMKSPSEYEAIINSTRPFMLVLSETYNPGWVAEGPWGAIAEENHFIVNGYANMWYIDRSGSYTLRIYFKPDIYMKCGILISLIIFSAIVITISRVHLRKLLSKLLSFAR